MPLTDGYVHRLDGMDGSHWQPDAGPINLALTKAIPTDWIAWKATQSDTYVDPTFKVVRAAMRQLGFRQRNYYHWIGVSKSPVAQAHHYLRTIGPWSPGEGVMLDGEEWDQAKERANPGWHEDHYATWLETVEEDTRRPSGVYAGLYVANGTIWRSKRIRMSKFGPRAMHLAAYVTVANLLARMRTLGVLDLPMHAWQWSSNGPVAGITGRCDMNAVIDRAVYDQVCGLAAAPVPPPEDDMKLRILSNADDLNDPHRWVTNGLVRVLPTEESIGWLVSTGQVEPGQDIWNPEPVSGAVLAGIPLVGETGASSPSVCRYGPGIVTFPPGAFNPMT